MSLIQLKFWGEESFILHFGVVLVLVFFLIEDFLHICHKNSLIDCFSVLRSNSGFAPVLRALMFLCQLKLKYIT